MSVVYMQKFRLEPKVVKENGLIKVLLSPCLFFVLSIKIFEWREFTPCSLKLEPCYLSVRKIL